MITVLALNATIVEVCGLEISSVAMSRLMLSPLRLCSLSSKSWCQPST